MNQFDNKISWLVSISSSLASLINVGSSYIFGIFFPIMLEEFQAGKARTALVGSFCIAVLALLCPLSSMVAYRYGGRIAIAGGGLTCALGLLGSAFARNLYVLYFTYGFVVGCGSCLVYMAAFLIVPLYFEKHRNVATALATVGPGAGLLIMSPVTQTLLEHLDWRKTFMVLAGINLISSFLGLGISRKNNTRPCSETSEQNITKLCSRLKMAIDVLLLKSPMFIIIVTTSFSAHMGHFMPLVHLIKYAEEIGISRHSSSWMYFLIGSVSMLCRILIGKLCDYGKVSFFHISQGGLILMALADFFLPQFTALGYLYAYAVFQGLCEAMYFTPLYCKVISIYPKQGMGWLMFFNGFAIFLAPVIAGSIADFSSSYKPVFYTAGCFLFLASLIPFVRHFIVKPEVQRNETVE